MMIVPIVEDEEEKRYSRSRDSTGTTKGHIYIAIFLALVVFSDIYIYVYKSHIFVSTSGELRELGGGHRVYISRRGHVIDTELPQC